MGAVNQRAERAIAALLRLKLSDTPFPGGGRVTHLVEDGLEVTTGGGQFSVAVTAGHQEGRLSVPGISVVCRAATGDPDGSGGFDCAISVHVRFPADSDKRNRDVAAFMLEVSAEVLAILQADEFPILATSMEQGFTMWGFTSFPDAARSAEGRVQEHEYSFGVMCTPFSFPD